MAQNHTTSTILIIDDEPESREIVWLRDVLEDEGWNACLVLPDPTQVARVGVGDAFENAAFETIEDMVENAANRLDAVVLDLEFGKDSLKGLSILSEIVKWHPFLPILVLTRHSAGDYRAIGARETLRSGFKVDYVDKLATAEEVVLRLRRLIGKVHEPLPLGSNLRLDGPNRTVYANKEGNWIPLEGLEGSKFDVFTELALAYLSDPGEVVSDENLERFYGDPHSRSVQINKINTVLKQYGLGKIVRKRQTGYRLTVR